MLSVPFPQRETDLLRHYTLSDEDPAEHRGPAASSQQSSASRYRLCVLRIRSRAPRSSPAAVRETLRFFAARRIRLSAPVET